MIVPARLLRRRLGLPPARVRVLRSEVWVPAADGTRLATRLLRPADPRSRRGTVLIRNEYGPGEDDLSELLAHWLAEDGRCVVLQSCRGRGRSEGSFRPFECEVSDGGAAIRWIGEQHGFDGPLALLGLGYAAYTAWAALAAAPDRVRALVAGFGARSPHAWLCGGGALQLEAALRLAARLDGRRGRDPAPRDLLRAGSFLPVSESDRVAWRELPAFREWIQHPEPDPYWNERTPPLPERPPATLQLAGWYDAAIAAQLADHRALAQRAESPGAPAPGLCVGPWGATALPRRERDRSARPLAQLSRAVLRFLARGVGGSAPRHAAIRVYVRGAGWREASRWPPERAETRTLYLRGAGSANSQRGDGRLEEGPPPADERGDVFVADPADPVPSRGGVAIASSCGPLDQLPVERRGDVLCFTSDPFEHPLELAGAVRARLHAASSAEASDLAAKLVVVEPSGAARWLCEGVAHCEPASAGAATRVEIALGDAAARVGVGERLRLEIAPSSVPRFARSPNTEQPRTTFRPGEGRAARQTVFHDARRPSALCLDVLIAPPRPGAKMP